jgi:malate permease and related proteins
MPDIYKELVPVFLMIFSGIILRYFGILKRENAHTSLQLVFYISLPALILANIPNTQLNRDFIFLPVIPLIIGIVLFIIARITGKYLRLERKTLGVFVISSLIINTAFAFPFVLAIHGQDGLSRILIIDIGNALFIYGFAYYQACRYGNHQVERRKIYKKLLFSVPLWAIFVAVLFNFLEIKTNGIFYSYLKMAGDLTIPLLLLAVGIFFEPRLINLRAMGVAIFIRMGLGMLMGIFLSSIFNLEGISRHVVIIATATPVGYNTLIFSSLEKLDSEFAAALVSVSILIAMVCVPFILFLVL